MLLLSLDQKKAFSITNLLRAWERINSSRKYDYKQYFRHLYKGYELSLADNLKDLQARLRRGTFKPTHAVKIYLPKKSGLLRTFSLLSVEDQIVYQAFANIIAEKLYPKARVHYNFNNFGHHSAGTDSDFFFRPWEIGYDKFKAEFKKSFKSGLVYTACFDYTAFYDTVDHCVLMHLLEELGLTPEFCQEIVSYLKHWTCTDQCEGKYHGHGIPQGPLTSGILGEVMLNYIDSTFCKGPHPYRYMRYVDDIRILSVDEVGARRAIMRLDILSKKVGLFPQSSKLSVHKIVNLHNELKEVSVLEESILDKDKNGKYLRKIRKFFKAGKVSDETSFKYLLARVPNDLGLEKRCISVLSYHPNLCDTIIRYLAQREVLQNKVAELLLRFIKESCLYEEMTAQCLKLALDRVATPELKAEYSEFCLELLKKDKIFSPNLKAQVYTWVLKNIALKYSDLESIITTEESWVVHNIMNEIDISLYGKPSYDAIVSSLLTHKDVDVHTYAAYLAIKQDIDVTSDFASIGHIAKASLKKVGKVSGPIIRDSTISESLSAIVHHKLSDCNWKEFFGTNHNKAERQILMCKPYARGNPTAFVNQFDSFNELVLGALFPLDSNLGNYQLGGIGGFLNSPTCALAINHKAIYEMCEAINLLRKQSELSHPIVKSTQSYTRPISYAELKKKRPILLMGSIAIIEFVFQHTRSLKTIKGRSRAKFVKPKNP